MELMRVTEDGRPQETPGTVVDAGPSTAGDSAVARIL